MNIKRKIEIYKRKRSIKKFKKFNFPKEMISELNDCFTKYGFSAGFYLPYPLGKGIEGTPLYQVFKKYGKEKTLKKIKSFPVRMDSNADGVYYYLDLEES